MPTPLRAVTPSSVEPACAAAPRRRDLGERLAPLCRALAETQLRPRNVRLMVSADPAPMEAGRCWLAGLIMGRLVEDIGREAFGGRGGRILIEVAAHGGEVWCCITNDGDPGAAPRGGGLVRTLLAELGGTIEWRAATRGSAAVVRFPG